MLPSRLLKCWQNVFCMEKKTLHIFLELFTKCSDRERQRVAQSSSPARKVFSLALVRMGNMGESPRIHHYVLYLTSYYKYKYVIQGKIKLEFHLLLRG